MKHFFSVYKTLEKKETVMDEVGDENEASRIVSECIERYSKCFKDGKQVKKLF
jgi:inorganic pyrophosphatase